MRFHSATPGFNLASDGQGGLILQAPPGWFVAKITGSFTSGGATYYSWAEQEPKEDGTGYRNIPNGKTGSSTANWAREINGNTGVSTNSIVLMRPVIVTKSGTGPGKTQLHEFAFPALGGATVTVQLLSDVTCANGSLTKVFKTLTIPGGSVT